MDAIIDSSALDNEVAEALPVPPVVPPPTTPVTIADFVARELKTLHAAAAENVWTRAGLLTALASRIRDSLPHWQRTDEPALARTTLDTLHTELSIPTSDPAEVDRRWTHTITTLTSLTTTETPPQKSRRTFWKH